MHAHAGVTERIDRFLTEQQPPTPCVVIDLDVVRQRHGALRDMLPDATIYYAVKANPAPQVIGVLAAEGCHFDMASEGEIQRCAGLGIPADRFCFGNTIKRERDIVYARSLGVDLFAFDAAAEMEKLARAAPGAGVFCRLSVHGSGAEWPLSRKFGCEQGIAIDLLQRAKALGLRPLGVSFHVGSQQTDPDRWRAAIVSAARVFHACARAGLDLELLNLGGGLPAHYRAPVPPLGEYIAVINAALDRHFGSARPRLMIEPGRYLTGDAGVLRSQVLLIARHGGHDMRRWVYLDTGRYNGLAETQGESIHYPLRCFRHGERERVVIAGPTCDSSDIVYDRTEYELPLDLEIGDSVDFLSAGAYTASYASVEFNGFPPLATYCV